MRCSDSWWSGKRSRRNPWRLLFTLTFTASERVTRKDETTSAHGVRRLAAAVRSWVIRGAEEREQSPALHSLERRSSSAVTASTFKKYL